MPGDPAEVTEATETRAEQKPQVRQQLMICDECEPASQVDQSWGAKQRDVQTVK